MPSTKQIQPGIAQQAAGAGLRRLPAGAAHYHHRTGLRRLAHYKRGRGCQLVGQRHLGHLEGATVEVRFADLVAEGFYARGSNRKTHRTIAPGPASTVIDDDRQSRAKFFLQASTQLRGTGIGIGRQEQDGAISRDIGFINTGIGVHITQLVFDYHHAGTLAQNRRGFPQYQLRLARILIGLRRKFAGGSAGLHIRQLYIAILGLADHFLSEYQQVATAQLQLVSRKAVEQQLAQVIPWLDEWKILQGDELQSVGHLVLSGPGNPGDGNTGVAFVLPIDGNQHRGQGFCRRGIVYRTGVEAAHTGCLNKTDYLSEAAHDVPVLLYFHGGAWQHGYKEWNGFLAPVIVDLPAIFVSASYRLVPEVNFPAPIDDAMAALDWVWRNIATYGGDPKRIFSGGWSVGGTLASLITLRRELHAQYGLPEDIIRACFAASGGYRYKHDVLAPGNSGKTYGDLMYERPEDELLAEPLHHVKGNTAPFYISWASDDFGHVMQSSQDMVDALKAEGCTVEFDVFNGVDHYDFNLAHGDPDDKWVKAVRRWMTQLSDS